MTKHGIHIKNHKNNNKKIKIMIAVAICIIVIVLITDVAIYLLSNNGNNTVKSTPDEITTTESTTPTQRTKTHSTTIAETTELVKNSETTISETQPTLMATFPEDMMVLLDNGGISTSTLSKSNCSQLVVVNSNGTSADIMFYECNEYQWSKDENLSFSGFVGTEGTVSEMSEQISGTPKGFYPIGEAFYIYDAPQTKLNTFQITQNTNWIDDPNSAFYNQRVEGTENQDWSSCEHMIDYADSYAYGFVVNYNMPAEYNKGSAIFMHVGYVPTQGCIATSTENILAYLSKLDCSLNPCILII